MKNMKAVIAILSLTLLAIWTFGQESAGVQIEPKKEGTVRIGIVAPKMLLGQEGSGPEAGEAIRQLWAGKLSGPAVEVVAIDAQTPVNINAEAKQKGCDFVLYSSLAKKRKTSLFGNLVKVAVPVLTRQIPGASNVDPNGTTVNSVQQTVAQAGEDIIKNTIAAGTSAKDTITLDFILTPVDGAAPVLKNSLKAKASADGEDVISPLIEKAAGDVAQAAVKK